MPYRKSGPMCPENSSGTLQQKERKKIKTEETKEGNRKEGGVEGDVEERK